MALDPDVPQDDHFVIAFDFLEGAGEQGDRVFAVAAEEFFIGADDAGGRVQQAFAVRVLPGPAQHGADGGFGLRAAGFFGPLAGFREFRGGCVNVQCCLRVPAVPFVCIVC